VAKLTTTEKQILEELFQMGGGYVLNFSDRTFGEFFHDDLSTNIFDQKYNYASGSKANRLRGFWQAAQDSHVAKSIDQLLVYIDTQIAIGRLNADKCPDHLVQRARTISSRLSGAAQVKPAADSIRSQPPTPNPNAQPSTPDSQKLVGLRSKFMELNSITPQERGFAFERFLNELFSLFHLAPRGSFRLIGEQIDGSFQIGQDVYLVEAKWQNQKTGQSDLLSFSGKVEGKAQWSRGLFISYSGFTDYGLEAFARGKSTRIICMDGFDLHCVLNHNLNLAEVVNRKMRRAGETNDAFISVRDLFPSQVF
jgi:Restriction endonuclease